MQSTYDRMKTSMNPTFYGLTRNGLNGMAQVLFQLSYALSFQDLETLALMQHQLPFVTLLMFVYYGVEHYVLQSPQQIQQLPPLALQLSFSKAFNYLGRHLASTNHYSSTLEKTSFVVPSGSNVLEVVYCYDDDISQHRGMPFDGARSYTMQAKVTVHTYEMLPVVDESCRDTYKCERLQGCEFMECLKYPRSCSGDGDLHAEGIR